MIKTTRLLVAGLLSVSLLIGATLIPLEASALSGSQFKAGRIIDDALFYNGDTMTVTQIQNFLNAKVPTCDTWGKQPYAGTTRAEYGKSRGYPAPYICLKNFKQDTPYRAGQSGLCSAISAKTGRTAAQIIDDVARACHISEKVIIVMLQKEQGLVTDDWPWSIQYRSAMGYGCPDTAACDSQYYGFFNQVYNAALQFQRYKADPTYWNHVPFMTNQILYQANAPSCGSRSVYIENYATAGLYNYTPYTPNKAALDNLYGEGNSCSAYGNRNFWRYYNDWFGTTMFAQPTGAMLYRQNSNGRVYLVANNKRFYISSWSVMKNYGLDTYKLIPASDGDVQAYVDGGNLTNIVRDGSGKIYLVNNKRKHYISSSTVCDNWNIGCFDTSVVRNLGDTFTSYHLSTGNALGNTALYNGVYYRMASGVRLPYADESSYVKFGYSTTAAINANALNITQPLGKLQIKTPALIKFSPKAALYYFNGSDYYTVPDMNVYEAWKLGSIKAISPPKSSYNTTDEVTTVGEVTYWHQTSDGQKYVINGGTKMKLSTAQESLWPTTSFGTGLDKLTSNLVTAQLGQFIKVGTDFYKLLPELGEKRYIAGMADYRELGGNSSNTTRVGRPLGASIASGPFTFANGRLIKVENDTTIYVMNDDKLMHVASMAVLNGYRFDTSKMKTYPAAGVGAYQIVGQLRVGKKSDGSIFIPHDKLLLTLTAQAAQEYGLKTGITTNIASDLTKHANTLQASKFWRNRDDGRIYYGSGGALHHVSSQSKFRELGGTTTPITPADSSTLSLFNIGTPL